MNIVKRWVLGRTVQRRIAGLDPESDHEEIARLTLQVLYGDPIVVHARYLVGFARQMAVPSIARVVYRGGHGDNLRHVVRRSDDTLTLLGEFLRWGHSSQAGRAAIARMEQIHSHFPITDEQKQYTLAGFVLDSDLAARHLNIDARPDVEREAWWHFWRGVAEQMPLGGLPPTAAELQEWMLDYEDRNWGYSEGGRKVVDAFFEDWTGRWFPGPLRPFGRQVLLALLEPRLRAVLRLESPRRAMRPLARLTAQAYFRALPFRVVRTDRCWADHFSRAHDRGALDLERLGHQAA
jgi:hypothetical protein